MDGILKEKEKKLEQLELDERIAEKRKNIAERRRVEKQMKKGEGHNWRKTLGIIKGLKPDKEILQDLYAVGGDLKEYSNPNRLRRL